MTFNALSTAPALVSVAILAIFAGLPGQGSAAAAADAPALEETSWLLVAHRDGNRLIDSAPAPRPARFRLEQGRIAGSAGCNLIGGSYTLSDTSLSFKANLTSTMMACPEPLMKQEQAVSVALTRVASYRLDGETLELLDAMGEPLVRLRWQRPGPLVGPLWQLTGYNNGKHANSSVRGGTEITIEFRDDGTLGGSDGCNRYMSGYTLTGEALTIGPLASTRMACKGPEGAAEQARAYAEALGTVSAYRIEGNELTLLGAGGKPAARFRAEAPAVVADEAARSEESPVAPAPALEAPMPEPTPAAGPGR